MRLSLAEGVCWALMIGFAETYFVASAVRLGASPLQLGLVVTLPLCLGAAGPLVALAALRRLRRRKWLVAAAAFSQSVVLAVIAACETMDLMSPSVLIVCVCFYNMAGQSAGTAWASWFGDVVPRERRGRYFSRRSAAVQLAMSFALVAGGLILEALEPQRAADSFAPLGLTFSSGAAGSAGDGFRLLFLVAVGCRLASAILLALTPEPAFRGIAGREGALRFLRSGAGSRARKVILAGGILYCVVYLGSPYFAPYMLEELRFSYLEYMFASLFVVVIKAIVFPRWGAILDHRGARGVFLAALCIICLIPVPWLLADGLGWVLAAQFLSGVGWSAFEVSYFALLLAASGRTMRPHLFAVQSVFNGAMQLLGGLAAGLLIDRVGITYRSLFALTIGGRLAIAVVGVCLVGRVALISARRRFSVRLVGVRPTGGLGYRPIEAVTDVEPHSGTEGVERAPPEEPSP